MWARSRGVAPDLRGLSAHERTGHDVRCATPYVTGLCVVAAGLPSAAALDEGGTAAVGGVRGSRGSRGDDKDDDQEA